MLNIAWKTYNDSLIDVIESLSPDCMAIEDLYSHYERPKTAIIMGHARGVILLAAKKMQHTGHDLCCNQNQKCNDGQRPSPQRADAIVRLSASRTGKNT